jgi:hypothetical protein
VLNAHHLTGPKTQALFSLRRPDRARRARKPRLSTGWVSTTSRPAPREVRRRLPILQHAEDVSGNVPMTCRHHGISQPVWSTRPRRDREEASTTIAAMPIRPSDSHLITTHVRLTLSSPSVII